MATIRKNHTGSVLLANGQFLAAGDTVPADVDVDPSLLEQEQQALDLGAAQTQADEGDDQGDASDASEAQADPEASDDEQADQDPDEDTDTVDDEDDILGTPEPVAEKPARRRSNRTRKSS